MKVNQRGWKIVVRSVVILGLAMACGPSVGSPPAASAASENAASAPISSVATALRGDPPLPGQASAGWSGLESDGGAASMAHHHMAGMSMDMKDDGHAP